MELDSIDRRNLEDSVLETVVYPAKSGLHEGPIGLLDMAPLLPDVRAADLLDVLSQLVETGLLRRSAGNRFEIGSPEAIDRAAISVVATHVFLDRRPNVLPS